MNSVTKLKTFRKRAYCLLGNGRDSVFDLMDAVLTSRRLASFAELSLSPRLSPNMVEPLYGPRTQRPAPPKADETLQRALTGL